MNNISRNSRTFPGLISGILFVLTYPFHFLAKYPVLFKNRYLHFTSYGLFAMLESGVIFVLGLYYIYTVSGEINNLLIFITLGAPFCVWTGTRIYHFMENWKGFLAGPRDYLFRMEFHIQGGMYGGLVWTIIASAVSGG